MGVRAIIGMGAAAALIAAAPASATPPGTNGPIVWQSFTGPAYEIWKMDANGSNQVELTDNSVHEERAQMSADRSKITFMSYRAGDGDVDSHEIYKMDADGTDQVALMDNDDTDFEPAWAPDGSKVIFMRQTTGVPAGEVVSQDLWTVPAAGGGQTNLTGTLGANECCAEYSPDGTKIAYTNSGDIDNNPMTPSDENEIWVMNANGTGQTRLTDNTAQDVGPTWSPDGEEIAWVNVDNGTIWTMDSDGTNEEALTAPGFSHYYAPSWSPDGTKIAAQLGNEIVAVDVANPASVANLSNNGATQDEYPNWAPGAGDPQDPVAQITELKVKSRKRKAIMSFTGTDDVDPPASLTFECQVDAKPLVSPCTSPHVFRRLKPRRHTVRVRAIDTEANVGAYVERTFRIRG